MAPVKMRSPVPDTAYTNSGQSSPQRASGQTFKKGFKCLTPLDFIAAGKTSSALSSMEVRYEHPFNNQTLLIDKTKRWWEGIRVKKQLPQAGDRAGEQNTDLQVTAHPTH